MQGTRSRSEHLDKVMRDMTVSQPAADGQPDLLNMMDALAE